MPNFYKKHPKFLQTYGPTRKAVVKSKIKIRVNYRPRSFGAHHDDSRKSNFSYLYMRYCGIFYLDFTYFYSIILPIFMVYMYIIYIKLGISV